MEFVENKETKRPFEREKRVSETITQKAFERGVLIRPGVPGMVDGITGDHILMTPPFTIEEKDIERLVSVLREILLEVQKEASS